MHTQGENRLCRHNRITEAQKQPQRRLPVSSVFHLHKLEGKMKGYIGATRHVENKSGSPCLNHGNFLPFTRLLWELMT